MPLLQALAFFPFVDSRAPRTENPHVFSSGRRHNPSLGRLRVRAFKKTKKGKKGRKDELSGKFETISRHGEDMEETRRMSTAATAAYQAAQVESRISALRELGTVGGEGWGSGEYAKGRARGEGNRT